MGYWQAIFLGIIQGLTEFLPVSSSGHLVVFQRALNYDSGDPAMIFFTLIVHLGTVVAILVYYRRSVKRYVTGLSGCLSDLNQPVTLYRQSTPFRITVLALAATFSTGIVFIFLKDTIESSFEKAPVVACCWIITATLLLITDRNKQVKGSLKQFTLLAALMIGLAQGAALFPGISRSGSTICIALLFGLRRRWAGEFSFLIGVPAICAATLIHGIKFFREDHTAIDWGPMLVGGLASAIVGLAALALLIWAVKRAKLKFFAIYCYLIAITTFIAYYGFDRLT